MVATIIHSGSPAGDASTANTTQYWMLNRLRPTTTETNTQLLIRQAGTIKNLYVRITANAIAGNTIIRTRKNAANGAQSVTVGSSATGVFEDTTNSDSFSAGDKLAIQSVPGAATNTFTISIASVLYDVSGLTVTRNYSSSPTSSPTTTAASTTSFLGIVGLVTGSTLGTTESAVQTDHLKGGTNRNMCINISANARTTTTTMRYRKNGANGNQNLAIGSTATGFIEDNTNSDTITAGDDVNYSLTSGTGTLSMTIQSVQSDFETSSSTAVGQAFNRTDGSVNTLARNTTFFTQLSTTQGTSATESNCRVKTRQSFVASNLNINVSANGITSGNTTVTIRKNGVDTAIVATIGASATGWVSDTTHTEAFTATDDINHEIVTGVGSGSQTISIRTWAFWYTITKEVTKSLATESVNVSESPAVAILRNKIRTRSETVSISETPARLAAKQRPIATQSTTISEVSLVRVKGKQKALATETVTISEVSLARLLNKFRTIPETVTKGETLSRLAAKNRALATETVTITGGTLARLKASMRAMATQTVSISENTARLKAALRPIATQVVSFSDSVARTVTSGANNVVRALATETVAISENLVRLKAASRTLSDTVPKSEAVARLKSALRGIPQSTSISEQVARLKAATRTLAIQTVSLSESTVRLMAKIRTLPQTISIAESVIIETSGEIVRALTETVNISEGLARLTVKSRAITQTNAITENVARVKGKFRALATEAVAMSENIARLVAKQRIISQTVTIPETLTRIGAKARSLAPETIAFSDSVTQQINVVIKHIVRTLTETVQILEQLLYVTDKWRSRYRRITDPSNKKMKSNHPAWVLGTRGMHRDYEEF